MGFTIFAPRRRAWTPKGRKDRLQSVTMAASCICASSADAVSITAKADLWEDGTALMHLATLSCTTAFQCRFCSTESAAPPPRLLHSATQQRRKCLILRMAMESRDPSLARSATHLLVGAEPLGRSGLVMRSASRTSTAATHTASALACQVFHACSRESA